MKIKTFVIGTLCLLVAILLVGLIVKPCTILGHKMFQVEAKEVTCTTEGWNAYESCERCGYSTKELIKATGHNWNDGTVISNPTCDEYGKEEYTCTACGEKKTTSISKTAHNWNNGTVILNPTCDEYGEKEYTCTACGEKKTEWIFMTDHNWNSGTVISNPTYENRGKKEYTCIACGEKRTESIPKLERPSTSEPSGWGKCSSCHVREATHGVYCDECYYNHVQDLYNNGISQTELYMWANGYSWYDDEYLW